MAAPLCRDGDTCRPDAGHGDVLREYYGGSGWHHSTEPYKPAWHTGLATLRVNGWTCYTPVPEDGRKSCQNVGRIQRWERGRGNRLPVAPERAEPHVEANGRAFAQ